MLQPGALGEGTFKDLVVHLNGWWYYELAELEALLSETPLRPPGPRSGRWTARTAGSYEANKDRPLADVLAESRGFLQRLEELLAGLPEPVLRESAASPWLQGRPLGMGFLDGCLEHLYGEHWSDVCAWIGRREAGG